MQQEHSSASTKVHFDEQERDLSETKPWTEELNELESLLNSALLITRGSCVEEAERAVESALRRAKIKAGMLGLGHAYESGVFLSTLHEVENDFAKLPSVLSQNASIMTIVQHNATPKHQNTSEQTQAGNLGDTNASSIISEPIIATPSQQQQQQQSFTISPASNNSNNNNAKEDMGIADNSSVLSMITTGTLKASPSDLESTAGTSHYSSISSRILQPLRSFADDIQSTPKPSKSSAELKLALSKREEKIEDMELAHNVDFDTCSSPKYSTKSSTTSAFVEGLALSGAKDGARLPMYSFKSTLRRNEDNSEDTKSPFIQQRQGSETGSVSGSCAGSSIDKKNDEGGKGGIVILKGSEMSPRQKRDFMSRGAGVDVLEHQESGIGGFGELSAELNARLHM